LRDLRAPRAVEENRRMSIHFLSQGGELRADPGNVQIWHVRLLPVALGYEMYELLCSKPQRSVPLKFVIGQCRNHDIS